MRWWPITIAAATGMAASVAWAQTQPHHQPYGGQQTRGIKALSELQIDDLRAGRGMGLALAAELNGYPGPIHVLELADALGLSEAQRTVMQSLVAAMRAETVPLGERLIAAEAALDQKFADRSISGETLETAVRAIGEAGATLRSAHLKYHLATAETLTQRQIETYNAMRGYAVETPSPKHHR
jgi:hypothetical protein